MDVLEHCTRSDLSRFGVSSIVILGKVAMDSTDPSKPEYISQAWLRDNVCKTIVNHPPVITRNRLYKPFPNGWFIFV